ncbi:MAG: hypothetical protein KC416_05825 [Myxococcales bacterium]|nr:hypothetical protein [Myxococcales bacterium]
MLPLALAAAVGAIPLGGTFVGDDEHAIVASPIVRGEVSLLDSLRLDFCRRPMAEGATWRPVMPILWRGLWSIAPNNPFPFRLVSLLLHVGVVGAFMVLLGAYRGARERWVVLAAASLFAVHGLHSEAVSAIVGHADLLSTGLGLWGLIAVERGRRGSEIAAVFLLACLVKESAAVLGFAAMVRMIAAHRGPGLRRAIPLGVVLVAVVAVQLFLPRSAETTTWNNALMYDAHGMDRLRLGLYMLGRGLSMVLVPHTLAPSHGFAAVDFRTETLVPYAVLGAGLLALGLGVGFWSLRRKRPDLAVAIMLVYGPAILASGLFVTIMVDLPERLLYAATAGVAYLYAAALWRATDRDRLRMLLVVSLGLALALPGLPARAAWRSREELWARAVVVEPKSVRHRFNHSNTLVERGDYDGALWHRMVAIYLVNGYPDRVDWPRIEQLERLPPAEAWRRGPAVLYGGDPCPMVIALLTQMRDIDVTFHDQGFAFFRGVHPQCLGGP